MKSPSRSRSDNRPARRRLMDDLLEAITSGQMRPGQQLPSSRELGAQYDTSHVNVSHVLRSLAQAGYVHMRHGVGTFVADAFRPSDNELHVYSQYRLAGPFRAALERYARRRPWLTVTVEEKARRADVFCQGPSSARRVAVQESMRPLDDLMAADGVRLADFHPAAMAVGRHGGRTYALPCTFCTMVLLYNADLVPSAVADAMTSWTTDDLLEAVRSLVKPLARRRISPYGVSHLFSGFVQPFLAQFGGQIVDETAQRCTLQEPEALDAFAYATELFHSVPHPSKRHTSTLRLLRQGKAAIVHASAHSWRGFQTGRGGDRIRMAPMPHGRFPAGRVAGSWLSIPTACEQPEKAWEFIRHLLSEETQHAFAKARALFPARREALHEAVAAQKTLLGPIVPTLALPRAAVSPIQPDDLDYLNEALMGWHDPERLPQLLLRAQHGLEARLHTFSGKWPTESEHL